MPEDVASQAAPDPSVRPEATEEPLTPAEQLLVERAIAERNAAVKAANDQLQAALTAVGQSHGVGPGMSGNIDFDRMVLVKRQGPHPV